ncbi:wax ester/triacylglycerol synthase family O-acyltransferase [Euzebya tangerina]|uniref:wax ester/triacylglycerol synthase family O-acyltransferase n=1 Tax=Euzebya tangerina TaxID=591198 RepID=UPI000E30D852|nr:wax ester/triacylglycerol synthase family O-acyltransferase [Euzebya tangerina]
MAVDRLSVLDSSFLNLETTAHHMHVGGLGVFEPGLRYADVVRVLRERIDRIPKARKRVVFNNPVAGRPIWVDDPDFDLSYHVRHAALPSPGDRGQLGEFLSRLMSRRMDRDRPLWEIYVIDGLEGDRVCLFRKVHLAMANGQDGDPFGPLLDEEPTDLTAGAGRFQPSWHPDRPPPQSAIVADAMAERVHRGQQAVLAVIESIDPRVYLRNAAGVAGAAGGLIGRLTRGAPQSPLNRRLSQHRRFATVECELEDLRDIRRAFGGNINDVVVAVVGDAVGRLLRWRGHETKDLDLKVMVPVRVDEPEPGPRGFGEARTVGDGVVGVLAPLPVMQMDPVARLYRIMGEMAGLKESRQAVAADQLVKLAGYAPPALHARAARLVLAEERYNVALSNAPGPQEPRYLAGTLLEESYPFIPLAGESALSIAVSSYAGRMHFGLLGDRDTLFDIERLGDFITESIADLHEAATSPAAGPKSLS